MNKYEVFTANYSKLIMADSEEEARQKFKAFIQGVYSRCLFQVLILSGLSFTNGFMINRTKHD